MRIVDRVARGLTPFPLLCTHGGVMVTPPSLPANIHDASPQGQDGLLLANASEADAGAFAAALGVTSVAAGYSDPKTCEDGLYCNVAPTVGGGIGGHARSEG
jgi:hypothetical protein